MYFVGPPDFQSLLLVFVTDSICVWQRSAEQHSLMATSMRQGDFPPAKKTALGSSEELRTVEVRIPLQRSSYKT